MAIRVYALLKTDSGGVDWSGLPLVCGWLGVTDIEELMPRLAQMKLHRTDKGDA